MADPLAVHRFLIVTVVIWAMIGTSPKPAHRLKGDQQLLGTGKGLQNRQVQASQKEPQGGQLPSD
jgi:hypothetical protein